MNKIDEMQKRLYEMASELEELKQDLDYQEQEVDFQRISSIASRYPIPAHPLCDYDDYVCKNYMILLLSAAGFDREHIKDSMTLAHRIAFGAEYLKKGEDLLEEWKAAQVIDFEHMEEYVTCFQGEELALMLVLELLLTAGNFKKGKKPALEYISQLCVLLKITKEELTFLSNMAVVILTGDLNQYHCDIYNRYDIFDGYLQGFDFPRKLIRLPSFPQEKKEEEVVVVGLFRGLGKRELDYSLSNITIRKEKTHIQYFLEYVYRLAYLQELIEIQNKNKITETQNSDDFDSAFYVFRTTVQENNSKDIIGVQTHYLDTEKNAKNYFIQKGGIVDEP